MLSLAQLAIYCSFILGVENRESWDFFVFNKKTDDKDFYLSQFSTSNFKSSSLIILSPCPGAMSADGFSGSRYH